MQWLAEYIERSRNPRPLGIGALLVGSNTNSGADPDVSLRPLDASGTQTLWFEILRDWRSG
jgi:hypothetical protein